MLYHRGAAGILHLSGGGVGQTWQCPPSGLMYFLKVSLWGILRLCVGDLEASVPTWKASIVTSCTMR